jgi:hypothetical protein
VTTRDLFSRVLAALDQAGIPRMLTGSFASSYHGAPRATQDIDLVISPTLDQVRVLVGLLPRAEYYVNENAAMEAVRGEGQFNVIDLATGWKIDLIVQKSRPFSREEFQRRTMGEIDGVPVDVASVEDLIVAKLEWAKLGGSERQIEDAAVMLRRQHARIDARYIEEWVAALGIHEQWNAARRKAGVPG